MHSDACAGVENMNRVSKKDLDVAGGAVDQAGRPRACRLHGPACPAGACP